RAPPRCSYGAPARLLRNRKGVAREGAQVVAVRGDALDGRDVLARLSDARHADRENRPLGERPREGEPRGSAERLSEQPQPRAGRRARERGWSGDREENRPVAPAVRRRELDLQPTGD